MAPESKGPFNDVEALALYHQYLRSPVDLSCPRCETDTIEVLAFIDPEVSPGGFATMVVPEGDYAVAVYCHKCHHSIGLRMPRE